MGDVFPADAELDGVRLAHRIPQEPVLLEQSAERAIIERRRLDGRVDAGPARVPRLEQFVDVVGHIQFALRRDQNVLVAVRGPRAVLEPEFIVQAQKNFLNGKAGKRAISNKEIADKLELSTSTVSRIVRNKYIQLPDKVIPLIALLERRINKHKEGKDVTGEDLQILLGQIIQNEDKSNPLSDENLKFALKDNFGVILSRRTIAKYRLELEIPSSRERLSLIHI